PAGVNALVIGGTQFIGRHTVSALLDHEYDVTIFNRGNHENPFDGDEVTHVGGDRTDPEDLERAAEAAQPDVVVDCVAYHPDEVRHAVDMFVDCDAYVVISSGSAYGAAEIPKREGETALCECTAEQERDD